MQHVNESKVAEPATPETTQLPDSVRELLARAAAACVRHGVGVEAFLSRAWTAYVEARPGLRERLEEIHLRAQLDELRQAGKVGQA